MSILQSHGVKIGRGLCAFVNFAKSMRAHIYNSEEDQYPIVVQFLAAVQNGVQNWPIFFSDTCFAKEDKPQECANSMFNQILPTPLKIGICYI